MNLRLFAKDTFMRVKGYEKVLLKDTKGVLTDNNNYTWKKVKSTYTSKGSHIKISEVLPSGTKVETEKAIIYPANNKPHEYSNKVVTKPNGTVAVYSNGKFIQFNNTGEVKMIDKN